MLKAIDMTKSQIFKAAHAEAKTMRGISYAEAFKFGLRRIYNKINSEAWHVQIMAEPEKPKFMWLRGME